jgi:dUTP pyrophosphatase
VKRTDPRASLPKRGNDHAAGYDLFALTDLFVPSGGWVEVPLGIQTEIPEGFFAKVFDRSGMGFKGLITLAGVIDSDYRGDWKLKIFNVAPKPVEIPYGKACAQFVLMEHGEFPVSEVQELSTTQRGEGGFGSTDKCQ